jgi:PRTRC genetic system ThiF family protein
MTQSNLLTSTSQPVQLRIPDFNRVYITLVGCGGTGSHIASGLAAIAQALVERSIAVDLFFVDPDRVEAKNVGRQLFSPSDLGRNKAEVLAERFNGAYGLRIMCAARTVDTLDLLPNPAMRDDLHIVIGAVDNPAARATIAGVVKAAHETTGGTQVAHGRLWWLDCGNENHSGQVLLGNVALKSAMRGAIALGLIDRLPAPNLVYPDLVATPRSRKVKTASCAELTAAGEQSLMINRLVAAWALSMLHDFLITRDLRYFGAAIDQQWGGMRVYTIDAPTISEACGLAVNDVAVKPTKGTNHGQARTGRNTRPNGQRR